MVRADLDSYLPILYTRVYRRHLYDFNVEPQVHSRLCHWPIRVSTAVGGLLVGGATAAELSLSGAKGNATGTDAPPHRHRGLHTSTNEVLVDSLMKYDS